MAVRVRYKITAFISSTTAEDKDLGNQAWEIFTDTQGEGGAWKTTLQPGDTNVQLNLGNLAIARVILIRIASKDPTLTPNAISFRKQTTSGEVFTVLPLGDAKEGHFMMSTDSITALFATNGGGGVAMEVTVVAAGD